jgi:hypothetical protein
VHYAAAIAVMAAGEQVLATALARLEWARIVRRWGDRRRADALYAEAKTLITEAGFAYVLSYDYWRGAAPLAGAADAGP